MRIRIFRRAVIRLAFERVVLQRHTANACGIGRTSALHKAVFVGQLLSILPIHGGQVGKGCLPSGRLGDRLRFSEINPFFIRTVLAQLQGDLTHLRKVRVLLILPVLRDLDRVALDLVGQRLAIFIPGIHVALHVVDGAVLDFLVFAIHPAIRRQAADSHGQTVGLVGFKGARIEIDPVFPIDFALHRNIKRFLAQAEGIAVVVPLLGEGQAGGCQHIGDSCAARLAVAADGDSRRICQLIVDGRRGFHHAELVLLAATILFEDVLPARRPVVVFRQGQRAALGFAVHRRADLPGSPDAVICAGQLALKLHRDFVDGSFQIGFVVSRPVLRDGDVHHIQGIGQRLAVAVRIVVAGDVVPRQRVVRNIIFHHAVLVGHVSAILPGPGRQVLVGVRPVFAHKLSVSDVRPVHAVEGVLERQAQTVGPQLVAVVEILPYLRDHQLGLLGGVAHDQSRADRAVGAFRQHEAGHGIQRNV